MFQTDLIVYLQSLRMNGLTTLLTIITELGDDKTIAIILMFITFGICYRYGILLMQIFQWSLVLNTSLKHLFALPRPTFVNGDIQNLQHGEFDITPFTSQGARSFWGSLKPEIISSFRTLNNPNYGFPSGHVSESTSLWGGMSLLFRKRFLYWLTPILVILIGFSRIYLGRHFLADVLGGLVLGTSIVLLTYVFLFKLNFRIHLFEKNSLALAAQAPNLFIHIFLFIIPLSLLIVSADSFGKGTGYLIGVNTALLFTLSKGLPDDTGSPFTRLARVLLATMLFFAATYMIKGLNELFSLDQIAFFDKFIEAAVPTFVSYTSTVSLGLKLKLYKSRSAKP
ncbi:MAG: phosphatase PAP2 family protein [Anaerolineales bacterium]|nr:phosphatase PAP2 family protein [Anaerolineales bacterium]